MNKSNGLTREEREELRLFCCDGLDRNQAFMSPAERKITETIVQLLSQIDALEAELRKCDACLKDPAVREFLDSRKQMQDKIYALESELERETMVRERLTETLTDISDFPGDPVETTAYALAVRATARQALTEAQAIRRGEGE